MIGRSGWCHKALAAGDGRAAALSIRLVLVSEDRSTAEFIALMGAYGLELALTCGARDFKHRLPEATADVLLLDLGDGPAQAAVVAVKQVRADIPLIVLLRASDAVRIQAAFEAGAHACFVVPAEAHHEAAGILAEAVLGSLNARN
jgi:DNA-binding NarL/FixJ family response regulator